VPADLGNSTSAQIWTDGGRTDPRHEQLVPRGGAHRPSCGVRWSLSCRSARPSACEEGGVPVGTIGGPPVVAAAEDGEAVGRRQLAHVGQGLDAGREDPPVGRHVGYPQRAGVGIEASSPVLASSGARPARRRPAARPTTAARGGEVIEVRLGPQPQLRRGDPQRGGHVRPPPGRRQEQETTSVRCTFRCGDSGAAARPRRPATAPCWPARTAAAVGPQRRVEHRRRRAPTCRATSSPYCVRQPDHRRLADVG
jgi:hypothetical protein